MELLRKTFPTVVSVSLTGLVLALFINAERKMLNGDRETSVLLSPRSYNPRYMSTFLGCSAVTLPVYFNQEANLSDGGIMVGSVNLVKCSTSFSPILIEN